MLSDFNHDVTRLLRKISKGDPVARDTLVPLVYKELQKIASHYLKQESRNVTIQTTDLVHEAYLRLVDESCTSFANRAHFFAIAARAMRQFLVYYAKKKKALKRGGGAFTITLHENIAFTEEKAELLLELERQLEKLSQMDPRLGQIVELRYFCGLTIEDTARVLNISPATVKREWQTAKAWLYSQLQ